MTQEDSVRRLAEIRERVDKATPGPWTTNEFSDVLAGEIAVAGSVPFEGGGVYQEDDADFIAHSREDVPYLLSVIDSLEADRERLREALRLAKAHIMSLAPGEPSYIDAALADVAFLMESIDSLTHLFHNKEHYEELVKGARLVRDEQQAEYECGFCTGGNDSHDDECVIPPFLAALAHIEESI